MSIRKSLKQWSREQLFCRTYGHRWWPLDVTDHPKGFLCKQRCDRCLNERQQVVNFKGFAVSAWRQTYQTNYLRPRGSGYIDQEDRALMRLTAIKEIQRNG